ncbi:50S ribosomal protein L20 [Elusimicrobiota bacterium]
MRVTRGKVKTRKHKKILKAAKGYSHAKSHRYRNAKGQLEKSLQYATVDRKKKKRDNRQLWITRISAACRAQGISYSKFIFGLKKKKINLDRRVLQEIAKNDSQTFTHLVSLTRDSE